MPALRYGRDITDDAAQLLRLRDEATAQARDMTLSPDVRDRAKERLKDINQLVRNAYGNIRTVRLFASEATPFEDTYVSAGRRAAGLNDSVQTRKALSKNAHAAMRRLQDQGRIPKITVYDPEAADSPVNIGRARPTSLTPRMQAGRAAMKTQGAREILAEAAGPRKAGKPAKEILKATSIGSANRAAQRRARNNPIGTARQKAKRAQKRR